MDGSTARLELRLLLVAVTMLAATALDAQTVKGVLVHEHTGAPVGGAYVVLLNEDSLETTRALTNPLGQFTLYTPRPGSYRLRTEIIGYRSFVSSPLVLVEGDIADVRLVLRPVTITLDPLLVEGARDCRVIGEQALDVLTVWEETRKVLTAVAWSELQEHFIHELERFERWFTPTFKLQHEKRSSTPTRHVMPFRSRSVEELEERGYVVVEEDSVVYEAPDAEVFFSPLFLQHHCFWLDEKEEDDRRKLGLRFEPVGGRTLPDVKGVFWLDAASGALERLELRYVNVGTWRRERGAAGELQFEQLPDGRWFVSRWWIRMPMVRRVESVKGPIWSFPEAVVGFEEEGGEVHRVYALDGRTIYARGRATVSGVVFDSTTGRGLEDAYVRLTGTDRVTISAADGSFWLTDLPEGRYTVTFTHPRATLLGFADAKEVVLEAGAETATNLALPSARTLVDRTCRDAAEPEQIGLLVGRVRDVVRDTVMVRARVRIVWLEGDLQTDSLQSRDVATDFRGVYRVCVPRNALLSVEVTVRGVPWGAVPAAFGESSLHVVDVDVRQPEEAPKPEGT